MANLWGLVGINESNILEEKKNEQKDHKKYRKH